MRDGKLEICLVLLFAALVRNDIAVLKLATPVYSSSSVELVNLASHHMLPHGFTCYITGWGLIQSCTTHTHALMHTHTQAYANT